MELLHHYNSNKVWADHLYYKQQRSGNMLVQQFILIIVIIALFTIQIYCHQSEQQHIHHYHLELYNDMESKHYRSRTNEPRNEQIESVRTYTHTQQISFLLPNDP